MKRLVTLILVLALSTVANAAMQLTINNSTAISEISMGDMPWWSTQVGIYKTDTAAEGAFIDYELASDIGYKYNLSNVAVTANAGNLGGLIDMGIWGTAQEYYVTIASSYGFSSPPGQVFNSTITSLGGDYRVTINLWDSTGNIIIDTATISIISPEPATLLLLGLGGLMLRKKK